MLKIFIWIVTDPTFESRLPITDSIKIYVPRDERFGNLKNSSFKASTFKAALKFLLPGFKGLFEDTRNDFNSLQDIMKLYSGGLKLPGGNSLVTVLKDTPLQFVKEFVRSDGEGLSKYSTPQVIQGTNATCTKLDTQATKVAFTHKHDDK